MYEIARSWHCVYKEINVFRIAKNQSFQNTMSVIMGLPSMFFLSVKFLKYPHNIA